ncbi:hypothetical protein BGX34_008423 [Mortierella sp. NVP85]|nr:hypothetical protein BGX34_008423 [Mortierella sp. NVP85]
MKFYSIALVLGTLAVTHLPTSAMAIKCTPSKTINASKLSADAKNVLKAWTSSSSISGTVTYHGKVSNWVCGSLNGQPITEKRCAQAAKQLWSSGDRASDWCENGTSDNIGISWRWNGAK